MLSLTLHFIGLSFLINQFIRFRHGNLSTVTILCYHSVDNHQAHRFEKQLDYLLEKGFQFISEDKLIELIASCKKDESRSRYICLTFDDCYENNFTIVRPILLRKKIPAIFFAITSKLGHYADWDDCISKQCIMTKDQLKEMALSFAIGGHTEHHVRLGDLKQEIFSTEIANSKKELTELIGREICLFAYPNGSYNAEVVKYVSKCQFEAAFTIEQHTNYSYEEKYTIGRYLVDPDAFMGFKLKVMGGYDWFFFLKKYYKSLFKK